MSYSDIDDFLKDVIDLFNTNFKLKEYITIDSDSIDGKGIVETHEESDEQEEMNTKGIFKICLPYLLH